MSRHGFEIHFQEMPVAFKINKIKTGVYVP